MLAVVEMQDVEEVDFKVLLVHMVNLVWEVLVIIKMDRCLKEYHHQVMFATDVDKKVQRSVV
jgi:hypothetical protein